MKKRILLLVALITLTLTGCQGATRKLGGSVTLRLQPNEKLEMITWKEDSLWYLTKPMTEDDVAETHKFQQSSEWGVFEGTVTIIESKK